MNPPKHSPLPWSIYETEDSRGCKITAILDAKGGTVAELQGVNMNDDATFLVIACNSFNGALEKIDQLDDVIRRRPAA